MRYGGLVARDAAGRRLPANFGLRGGRLLLRIDDRGASYPITIDPFIQEQPKLIPSDATGSASFGDSVAFSSDGNTLLVGGPSDNAASGAAWGFVRAGTTWAQQGAKLVAPDGGGNLGAVALSADGNTALVGAPGADGGFEEAWVFTRSNGVWNPQPIKLAPSYEASAAHAGYSVALTADGSTALIGGPYDWSGQGTAWVFVRSGGTWSEQTALNGYYTNDFGLSVALSTDGSTALVGGPSGTASYPGGAAYAFTRSNGSWTMQKLIPNDESGAGLCGTSAALSADGNMALVGGPWDNAQVGAAWVFSSTNGLLRERTRLMPSDFAGSAHFGEAVSLSGDGKRALIGGWSDGGSPPDTPGAAWVFADLPAVTDISPASGPTAGGTKVTIVGNDLDGARTVKFGSSAASFTVDSSSQITATSSPASPGTVDVSVTTAAGTSPTSAADRFTYASPANLPVITALVPNVGAAAGGTQVTLSGNNLAGASTVRFGATAATFRLDSASQITTTSPPRAVGTVDVTVTTPAGTSGVVDADRFTYTALPPVVGKPSLSHASLIGVATRKARLTFTLTAGRNASPLARFALTPPAGMSFSTSKRNLRKGISLLAQTGAPIAFASRAVHGSLTITLKSAASKVRLVVHAPETIVSARLAARVRQKRAGTVKFALRVIDASQKATRLTLKLKPR